MSSFDQAADRINAAVEKAEIGSEILSQVANGDEFTEVPTTSGPVPSLKKWQKDNINFISGGVIARVDKAILSYPDYTSASAAAATLPDGQRVEILSDAAHSNLITRYEVQGGSLVYKGLAFDASSELFKPYFEGSASRTTREKLEEHISIADFGATGVDDPARDDTDAFIKAAVALTISQTKRLYIPKGVYLAPGIGAGVLLPAGTQVFGDGEGVTIIKDPVAAANRSIFIAGGNSIVVSDMTLEGGQGVATTTYYANSVAIRNENDGKNYEDILVQRVETRGWGDGGVRLWRPKRCRVEGSNLHDLGRFGVFMFGGEDNRIWFNKIKSIKPGNGGVAPFINSYGFSFSCDVSEAGFPKSKNCLAAFNVIDDVPTWEAMDIHGGDGIDILFNTVTDCMIGLFAGPASGSNNVALDNCRIHGNRMKTSTTYRRGGIIVAPTYSVGTVYGKNIQVTQNTIDGFGKNQAAHDAGFTSLEGALHIVGVDGVDANLNTIENFNCAGVYVRQSTLAAKVFDNTVRNGEPTNGVATAYLFETNTSVVARFASNSAIRTSGSEFTAFDILGGGATGDFGIRMESNNDFVGMATKFGASARGRLHPSSQETKTIRARAYVTNNGTTATIVEGFGFSGVARASAGRVTLTLAEAAPSANYGIFPTYRGGQARFASAGNNTATTFDVFVWDIAGALIDGGFYVEVVW